MMVPMADMLNHVSKHTRQSGIYTRMWCTCIGFIVYHARCLEMSPLTFTRLCTGVFEDGVRTAH